MFAEQYGLQQKILAQQQEVEELITEGSARSLEEAARLAFWTKLDKAKLKKLPSMLPSEEQAIEDRAAGFGRDIDLLVKEKDGHRKVAAQLDRVKKLINEASHGNDKKQEWSYSLDPDNNLVKVHHPGLSPREAATRATFNQNFRERYQNWNRLAAVGLYGPKGNWTVEYVWPEKVKQHKPKDPGPGRGTPATNYWPGRTLRRQNR